MMLIIFQLNVKDYLTDLMAYQPVKDYFMPRS